MSDAVTTNTTVPTSKENRTRETYLLCIEELKEHVRKIEADIETLRRAIEILDREKECRK